MREIKFRVWIESEKRYFYFTLAELIERNYSNYSGDWDAKIFRSEIREQFTGLHDKNGKEIYEGDIVKTETCITVVVFDECQFGLKAKADENYVGALMDLTTWHSLEVIGNIHENPELLS